MARSPRPCRRVGKLHGQGRFTDAGRADEQGGRPAADAAAEHAVERLKAALYALGDEVAVMLVGDETGVNADAARFYGVVVESFAEGAAAQLDDLDLAAGWRRNFAAPC